MGQDLWLGATGCIGDWFLPDFIEVFKQKYPDMVKTASTDPGYILFNTKLGKLARILAFILKGKTHHVKKCYKVMTRIDSPYEILEQKSSQGKFIYKKFEKINQEYVELLEEAKKQLSDDPILLYIYQENKMSFSGDLANELMHRCPTKLVIVGREKDDEIRMSLRYTKPIQQILKNALAGLDGYGGGHEYACGASIKKIHFKEFLDKIRKQL